MEIQSASVTSATGIAPGTLFYLLGGNGTPLMLRASFGGPDEDRMIPLKWDEEPGSVGVAMFLDALTGPAVAMNDAVLDVDPTSAVPAHEGFPKAVFQSDDELYFPLVRDGRIKNFVNARTGRIVDLSGAWVAFERWLVTIPTSSDARRTVLSPQDL